MDIEFDKDDDKISNSSLMEFESEKNKKDDLSEQPSVNPNKNRTSTKITAKWIDKFINGL